MLRKVTRNQQLSKRIRYRVLKTCVFSSTLFGVETLRLTRASCDKLNAFQLKQTRLMLNIFWRDRLKNEEVRRMVNETSTLAQAARFRWLNFAFHILRHDSLVKDILDDWGSLDLNKLPKRTWMYEVLKDISLVRDSSGRFDPQIPSDRNTQGTACWNSI